jgi:uncharacterized delta-60 repeat protein
MAVQTDGKVLVAGTSSNGIDSSYALARYNTDGTLDPTFGSGGKTPVQFRSTPGLEKVSNVVVQADGKIVVVGGVGNQISTTSQIAVARFNSDGSLDSSFGTGGLVLINHAEPTVDTNFAPVGTLQADQKILVAVVLDEGSATGPSMPVLELVRLQSDGSLDASFGANGQIEEDSLHFDQVRAIAVQIDNKIVTAGATFATALGAEVFAVARFNPDGSADTSFGTGGEVLGSQGSAFAKGLAVQPDGRLVVTGVSQQPSGPASSTLVGSIFVARYLADGSLDTTFASHGVFTTGPTFTTGSFGSQDRPTGLALQADRKIVVTGPDGDPGSESFLLLRLNPDGTLDTRLNGTGQQTTKIGSDSPAAGVAVLAMGKIEVVGGTLGSNGHSFALTRYNADGSLDASFGTGGIATTDFVGPLSSVISSVFLVSGGKILAVGSASNGVGARVALARYDAQGNLDSTFGAGGQLLTNIGPKQDCVKGAAVQADGKILIAGKSAATSGVLLRYNPDGTLDTSFGMAGGGVTFPSTEGAAVALQNDGKILVIENNSSSSQTVQARYNSDGSLDSSITQALGANLFYKLTRQPDGSFLAAGQQPNGAAYTMFRVDQRNLDGTPTAGFGMQGTVLYDPGTMPPNPLAPSASAADAALASDHRVLAVGNGAFGGSSVTLVRYQPDGAPDASFGDGGLVTIAFGSNFASLVLQPNGLIVVGSTGSHTGGGFALAVVHADGSFDNNFSSGGQVTTDFPGSAAGYALALQADGKIVVGGYATISGTQQFALARYLGDTMPPGPARVAVDDNARGVAGVYHDLLNRPVDPSGLAAFTAPLDASRAQALPPIATIYVTSAENRGNAIRQDCSAYLGRSAGPAEVNVWLTAIGQGTTLEQVRDLIVGSGEYFQRSGGSNSTWLDHVYLDLLGRPRDPGSQGFLDALNHGMARPAIVALMQGSAEYETRLVNATYVSFLNRPAGSNEPGLWFGLLNAGPTAGQPSPVEQFEIAVLSSAEYFQRHDNGNQGWVMSLYTTLLGRAPDVGGYEGALQSLLSSYAQARQPVGLAVAGSVEYQTQLVQGYYAQFLFRSGRADEIAGWVNLLQAGAPDEQVMVALASSDEAFHKGAGTNDSWFTMFVQAVLGRVSDPQTDGNLIAALHSGATHAQVAAAVLTGQEYRQRLVQSMFTAYLGRQASTADLNLWLTALAQGARDEVIRADILASDEYFQRRHSYP